MKFWFATGGAGFCLSRALALKMMPVARYAKYSTMLTYATYTFALPKSAAFRPKIYRPPPHCVLFRFTFQLTHNITNITIANNESSSSPVFSSHSTKFRVLFYFGGLVFLIFILLLVSNEPVKIPPNLVIVIDRWIKTKFRSMSQSGRYRGIARKEAVEVKGIRSLATRSKKRFFGADPHYRIPNAATLLI